MADVPSGQSSAQKSARKSVGRPFAKGHDPRQGRGPAKGSPNAGRPPNEFKAKMQALASWDQTIAGLEEILNAGPSHSLYLAAVKHCTEHGYGKPAQDITSGGKPLVPAAVNVRLVKPDAGG